MAKSGIVFLVCISTVPVPLVSIFNPFIHRGHYSGQLLKTVYFKYVAFKGIVLHQQLQGTLVHHSTFQLPTYVQNKKCL